VLSIIDAATGDPVPARRGLTRVEAHVPGYDDTGLRVLLVADVLVRALELGGSPVRSLLAAERDRAELRAGAAALGMRPFEDIRDAGPGIRESQVMHVVSEGGATPDGVRVAVAPVVSDGSALSEDPTVPGVPAVPEGAGVPEGPAVPDGKGSAGPTEGRGTGPRPTAESTQAGAQAGVGDARAHAAAPDVLRLALLSLHHSHPARIDPAALADAHDTLVRWRRAVAVWARQPSRPVPDEVRAELRTAWEDDLDVPGVLRVLRRVETSDLPEGARFETYVYTDRLLGLELARDLGAFV
jgi:hypothetical protein